MADDSVDVVEQRNLIDAYVRALRNADGDLAAQLFEPDGIIDDLLGGHHHGSEEIRRFISNRPSITVDDPTKVRIEGSLICVYGMIHYTGGDDVPIRWLFRMGDRGIRHLSNSRLPSLEERALATH